MKKVSRRHFLKKSAIGMAGVGVATAIPMSTWAQVQGANDDIRVAIVGHRNQGRRHIGRFDGKKGCRVVALCDADKSVMERDKQNFFTKKNRQVKLYQDYRKLLEDEEIDAIVTATPNHWHALVGIWACQAGKDVYVEKPVSHNIWEGRKLVEAARKYNRIVQTGTQKRSDNGRMSAIKFIQDGNIGKILWSRGFCYNRRGSIGKVDKPTSIPDQIDYDLWCGPAPKKPLMRKRLHYDWHWVWDTGNGDLGNQGIHEMDIARWALGEPLLAPAVISIGGRLGYDDDGETANTQIIYLDYKTAPLIFEVRGLPMKKGMKAMPHYRGIRIGNVVQCEGGYWAGGKIYDKDGKTISCPRIDGGGNHHQNFLDAVRSRKQSDLNAEIYEGHISSALCHMGNISHRLGQEKSPDEIKERLQDYPEAQESFERMKEHLADNEVDITKTKATLGPWLKLDPKTEKFVGPFAEEANKLRTREYRKPFVVPKRV